jgi:poly [ADP-ribose] polymerase
METNANHSLRTSKLIMVTADNHNKFYDMHQNCDATFTVTYG